MAQLQGHVATIEASCGVEECRAHIILPQIGEFFDNLYRRQASGQEREDIDHADTPPANASPSTALLWVSSKIVPLIHSQRYTSCSTSVPVCRVDGHVGRRIGGRLKPPAFCTDSRAPPCPGCRRLGYRVVVLSFSREYCRRLSLSRPNLSARRGLSPADRGSRRRPRASAGSATPRPHRRAPAK